MVLGTPSIGATQALNSRNNQMINQLRSQRREFIT
jgi:hypothetical protein